MHESHILTSGKLCDLKSLEILDLGRNQLRVLPPDIAKLTSLKVLSVPKNQIRELPMCLADMSSLQVLKFEGNPISFPPKDAIQTTAASPPNDSLSRDTEVTEVAVTSHIKKFLKNYAMSGRMDMSDIGGDVSSDGPETPRFPLKRVASGRFPIRVNGSDVTEMRSPNSILRPPPIPSRSHYRGYSQHNTAVRRPGVMPLTIGSVNERLRSNSETIRSDRHDGRYRRMGIISKKTSDMGTLDENEPDSNRFSHYRGLSHGSAMQGVPVDTKSPATPAEPFLQRPIYVRRLSVLPERRRESKVFDPIIEAAKGILYSVFQIHPMIQMLMNLTNDDDASSARRSSLEIVFYNTNSHVEELEQEIQKYDTAILEDSSASPNANENVYRACQTLVNAYKHVCTLLVENLDAFVNNGDARYIRTLLMLLYNSIMELRVTITTAAGPNSLGRRARASMAGESDTIRPYYREASAGPPTDRTVASRSRNGTVVQAPGNLRVYTEVGPSYANGPRRMPAASPRSKEHSASNSRHALPDFSEEEVHFERIFLLLQRSTDMMMRTLPAFNVQLADGLRNAMQQHASLQLVQDWKSLIVTCTSTIQQTEMVRNRLAHVKLRDPGVRSQAGFWNLCVNFVQAWTGLVSEIKTSMNKIPVPSDTRARLKPIQQSMKETTNAMVQSPWQHFFRSIGANGKDLGLFQGQVLSPSLPPLMPQSASLGPAIQATVPTTPQSASFAAAFQGNVFDRADALIANPGISMSRTGTMTRGHSNLSSLSSISSMSSDGMPAPQRREPDRRANRE